MENYMDNVQEIWNEIEPEISKLRYEKWVDPILVDRFEALLNHYEGNLVTGSPTAVLGKLESLTTMLSMDSYYRTRNTSEPEKKRLLLLNDNLLLLRQILVAVQREEEKNKKKPEVSKEEERLPNDDAQNNKEYDLYDRPDSDKTQNWNFR
jgi:hypothetical protein